MSLLERPPGIHLPAAQTRHLLAPAVISGLSLHALFLLREVWESGYIVSYLAWLEKERKLARLSTATPLISERFDSLLGVLDLGHFSFVFLSGVSKPLVFSVSAGLSVPGAAHAVDGMPCLPMTKRKMMGGD